MVDFRRLKQMGSWDAYNKIMFAGFVYAAAPCGISAALVE
jgi:hypothetical protein